MSRLFVYCRNLSAANLQAFFPEEYRLISSECVSVERLDTTKARIVVEFSEGASGPCSIVPCLAIAGSPYGFQCSLTLPAGHSSAVRVLLEPVGLRPEAVAADVLPPGVRADIDSVTLPPGVQRWSLCFRIEAADIDALMRRPLLLSVSVTQLPVVVGHVAGPVMRGGEADVPPLSQMEQPPEIRMRICSPACVTMVLRYYGVRADIPEVAGRAYHAETDLYGVWPANIRAAAMYGMLGYLYRFADFHEALLLLRKKIPLIATIRYRRGELTGACVPATAGHLVVVRGCRDNSVAVNDPGAPDAAGVVRCYELNEFQRVWIGARGIGYVLIPAGDAGRS